MHKNSGGTRLVVSSMRCNCQIKHEWVSLSVFLFLFLLRKTTLDGKHIFIHIQSSIMIKLVISGVPFRLYLRGCYLCVPLQEVLMAVNLAINYPSYI